MGTSTSLKLEHTLWWRSFCKDATRWKPGPIFVRKLNEALEERAKLIDEEIFGNIDKIIRGVELDFLRTKHNWRPLK